MCQLIDTTIVYIMMPLNVVCGMDVLLVVVTTDTAGPGHIDVLSHTGVNTVLHFNIHCVSLYIPTRNENDEERRSRKKNCATRQLQIFPLCKLVNLQALTTISSHSFSLTPCLDVNPMG